MSIKFPCMVLFLIVQILWTLYSYQMEQLEEAEDIKHYDLIAETSYLLPFIFICDILFITSHLKKGNTKYEKCETR